MVRVLGDVSFGVAIERMLGCVWQNMKRPNSAALFTQRGRHGLLKKWEFTKETDKFSGK